MYTRASLSVRSVVPSLTWIERVSGADHPSRGISQSYSKTFACAPPAAPHSDLMQVAGAGRDFFCKPGTTTVRDDCCFSVPSCRMRCAMLPTWIALGLFVAGVGLVF